MPQSETKLYLMDFNERLSDYMDELNISVHELAVRCEVSDAVISRYRSGSRTPRADSEILIRIADVLSEKKREQNPDAAEGPEQIFESLRSLLPNAGVDSDEFVRRASLLVKELNISISAFARSANYDSSFISRVLNGERKPSDYGSFARKLATYAAAQYMGMTPDELHSDIPVPDENRADDPGYVAGVFEAWLINETPGRAAEETDSGVAGDFLEKLDSFNLETYIRAVKFDKLKVPTIPFRMPTSKKYYGESGMKEAELDFLRSTALSPNEDPLYMYSTMPIESLAQDKDFAKSWMFGLACVLKKGHDIHSIHDLSRPLPELMAGLENWIPLYMTGQIHSYYLPEENDRHLNLLMRASGVSTVWGSCVSDDLSDADFYLTKKTAETIVYRKRINAFFSRALPLMDTYQSREQFEDFLKKELADPELTECRRKMSVPPLHTMSEDILIKLADKAGIGTADRDKALAHLKVQKEIFNSFAERGRLTDSFPDLSEEEFAARPVCLPLSGAFLTSDIPYTYEMYREHIALTREAAGRGDSYRVIRDNTYPFRNIQTMIVKNKWALVSKNTSPTIHFIIRHPVLVDAISRFVPPVME